MCRAAALVAAGAQHRAVRRARNPEGLRKEATQLREHGDEVHAQKIIKN